MSSFLALIYIYIYIHNKLKLKFQADQFFISGHESSHLDDYSFLQLHFLVAGTILSHVICQKV